MLMLRVRVPFTSFRNPIFRTYLKTELMPPPSTCYGFLLSLIGCKKEDRWKHRGVRLTPSLLSKPHVNRLYKKFRQLTVADQNHPSNSQMRYVEVLTNVDMLLFVDSSIQPRNNLEESVRFALAHPEEMDRFGGLTLGNSDALVDYVREVKEIDPSWTINAFLKKDGGPMKLTAWPDYLRVKDIKWSQGFVQQINSPPPIELMCDI